MRKAGAADPKHDQWPPGLSASVPVSRGQALILMPWMSRRIDSHYYSPVAAPRTLAEPLGWVNAFSMITTVAHKSRVLKGIPHARYGIFRTRNNHSRPYAKAERGIRIPAPGDQGPVSPIAR